MRVSKPGFWGWVLCGLLLSGCVGHRMYRPVSVEPHPD
jgi:hypothetical protein